MLLFAAIGAQAATFYVSPTGNDANNGTSLAFAKQTIQAGINVATSGDTILVADGAYGPITITPGVTVRSVNGAQTTMIDGGGVTRCVRMNNAVLDGFTVTNGYSFSGGGVFVYSGGTVKNCTISGNEATFGGGVRAYASTVENCTISGNEATFGGGVHAYAYASTVENCTISGNTADRDGGGVFLRGGTVQNCTINENIALLNGGGAYLREGTVENCTISGNTSYGSAPTINYDCGGGVFVLSGIVRKCTITQNTALWDGGGAFLWGGTLENCTISGNDARSFGGGVTIISGTVQNCLISGNRADDTGGGVHAEGGTMENCTISGNTVFSDSGGRGVGSGAYILAGTVRNCIVYYNQDTDVIGAISYSCMGTGIAGVGNITNEPQFVSAGIGYGTNLVPGDYHLRPTSPCINAGINQAWMDNAVDLDGLTRVFNNVVDMGAYEWSGTNILIMRNPTILYNQCGYGANATSQTIEVWNNAGKGAMTYALSADVSWLSLSPASGTSTGETDLVSVSFASAGLAPGTYTGIVTITSAEAINSPQIVTVYLSVDKVNQMITFLPIASQPVTGLVGLAATASSGLPVCFSVASGPGTISGGTNLSFTAAGIVCVVASQAGDSIWKAATPVTNVVIVTNPGAVQFNPSSYTVNEDAGIVTLTVTRTGGFSGPATVDYATADGTASAGSDYTSRSGTLSWSDGDTSSKTITVDITDDSIDENDEIYTVTLMNAVGAGLGSPGSATVTIVDNDNPPAGVIQFAVTSTEVGEDGGSVTLSVTRTGGNYGSASVEYMTVDGTALAGADYTSGSGTLSWPDGDTSSKTITVDITDESIDENDETFTVILRNAVGAGLGSPNSAIVTIIDNDIQPANTADIEVSGFKFVPVNLWAGDHPAEIEFDLINNGPADIIAAVNKLEFRFYLSSNTAFGDEDDLAIGTKTEFITLLAGTQTTPNYPGRPHNTDVTIPDGLSGDYYVFVSVRLVSQSGLSDPDGAYAMRDGPIRVRIHPSDDGDNSKQRSVLNDYDADGKSDLAVYQKDSGYWYILLSASGEVRSQKFGALDYSPVPGDYDGDGKTDPAIYQESSGSWYVKLSASGEAIVSGVFGGMGYTPVPRDYDGDGKTDPALYQETTEQWQVMLSAGGYGIVSANFGAPGYSPVPGDYDGDGKSDLGLYQESSGNWYEMLSSAGYRTVSGNLGGPGYRPVPEDYDGDGQTDPGVYQGSSGNWYMRLSESGTISYEKLEGTGYEPVPGDYDGDGKTDLAVYHEASGSWYMWPSDFKSISRFQFQFGGPGYTPVVVFR